MEERLAHLLVRILIVSGCVVESAKEFLATLLMSTSVRQFFHESAYCILVSNSEFVRVASHDRTSVSENYTVQGSLPVSSIGLFSQPGVKDRSVPSFNFAKRNLAGDFVRGHS
jgi:hypothetical protein